MESNQVKDTYHERDQSRVDERGRMLILIRQITARDNCEGMSCAKHIRRKGQVVEEYIFMKRDSKSDIVTEKEREKHPTLDQSQDEAGDNADTNNSPTSNLDLLVRNTLAHIPHQMAQTVERVVSEREASNQLGQNGKSSRPSSERGSKTGRLKVPAEGRSDQV